MKTQNAPVGNYVARETKDACGVTRYSILCDGELMADCLMRSDSVALAAKLNEHAALVAVAEAAQFSIHALKNSNGWTQPFKSKTSASGVAGNGADWIVKCGGDGLLNALANLAAVRAAK